jgi:hypothetical protein
MEGRTMRKLITALLLITPLSYNIVFAQAGAIDVVCADCRDPYAYPDDYVNFAFNQVYGDRGWMSPRQADDFFIHNLAGDRIYVDVDFVMSGIRMFGNRLPIWPTNLLKITIALPNGRIYTAIRSVFQTSLPVPSPSGPGYGDHDSNDEGEDEDEYETGIEEFEEPEIDSYTGFTDIEDPDENGEFTDADWCEEC